MKEYSQLQYALSYIKLGFAIFPLKPRSKIPLAKNGFGDATKDITQVKQWWSEHPSANIGIATGSISGNLFVIDFDIDEDRGIDGYHAFTDYCRENGVSFPDTVMVITGRKGTHWYYRSDREVGSRTGIIEGVDLRGMVGM